MNNNIRFMHKKKYNNFYQNKRGKTQKTTQFRHIIYNRNNQAAINVIINIHYLFNKIYVIAIIVSN